MKNERINSGLGNKYDQLNDIHFNIYKGIRNSIFQHFRLNSYTNWNNCLSNLAFYKSIQQLK